MDRPLLEEKSRKLCEAVEQGKCIATLKRYVRESGKNVDFEREKTTLDKPVTALQIACDKNLVRGGQTLLRVGADPNKKLYSYGTTPLMFYARSKESNSLALAKELLDKNVDVDEGRCYDGKTALMFAAAAGKVALIEELIRRGANIEATDLKERTAIFYAVEKNRRKSVEVLLKSKANGKHKDKQGNGTMIVSCSNGLAVEITKMLKSYGVNVNETNLKNYTAIMAAAENKAFSQTQLLLELGADPNASCADGITALMIAASLNAVNIVRALTGAKVNTEQKNKSGSTALFYAARTDALEAAEALVVSGAQVNTRNNKGETPLMWASRNNAHRVTNLLLQKGAKTDVVDTNGKTALMHCCENDSAMAADILLKREGVEKKEKSFSLENLAKKEDATQILKLLAGEKKEEQEVIYVEQENFTDVESDYYSDDFEEPEEEDHTQSFASGFGNTSDLRKSDQEEESQSKPTSSSQIPKDFYTRETKPAERITESPPVTLEAWTTLPQGAKGEGFGNSSSWTADKQVKEMPKECYTRKEKPKRITKNPPTTFDSWFSLSDVKSSSEGEKNGSISYQVPTEQKQIASTNDGSSAMLNIKVQEKSVGNEHHLECKVTTNRSQGNLKGSRNVLEELPKDDTVYEHEESLSEEEDFENSNLEDSKSHQLHEASSEEEESKQIEPKRHENTAIKCFDSGKVEETIKPSILSEANRSTNVTFTDKQQVLKRSKSASGILQTHQYSSEMSRSDQVMERQTENGTTQCDKKTVEDNLTELKSPMEHNEVTILATEPRKEKSNLWFTDVFLHEIAIKIMCKERCSMGIYLGLDLPEIDQIEEAYIRKPVQTNCKILSLWRERFDNNLPTNKRKHKMRDELIEAFKKLKRMDIVDLIKKTCQ